MTKVACVLVHHGKLETQLNAMTKERDQAKDLKLMAERMLQRILEERDELKDELISLQRSYDERGMAMRETGEQVRSLFQGEDVSKRIIDMTSEIEILTKERDAWKLMASKLAETLAKLVSPIVVQRNEVLAEFTEMVRENS